MNLRLYTMPGTVGVAIHIALEEIGASYELTRIDFPTRQQYSDDYRKVNPKQRVPTLIVDGEALNETPAILFYLAQTAPTSTLALPADPMAQAKIQSFNSYLCSTVHIAHAHKQRGARWTDDTGAMEAMTAFVTTSMTRCFDLIETELIKGPWVHGENFSISDPYLFAISRWLERDQIDIARFPKVSTHHQRMLERASVQTVLDAA